MQIFHRSTNTIAKVTIFGAVFFLAFFTWMFSALLRSSYATGQGVIKNQPVPFSHAHHVKGLGIDCRYCHTTVEESSYAGMPATETCINCHKQIWSTADMLEPVRASFANNVPIEWVRVHDLPDFVYFNHSIHVAKGIGCATCHGDVGDMPLMLQASPLTMEWCLACHRDPAQYVRPREEVFNLEWQPPADPREATALRARLIEEYDVESLTSCSTCHR